MPPKQCPACGRFLKNAFVDALDEAAAPCPACGGELVADMFAAGASAEEASTPGLATGTAAGGAAAGSPPDADQVSVRPPDLEPAAVRDATRDVLAGWDVTADAAEIASWQRDRRPFPTDTVVVVGSGALGGLAGGVIGRGQAPRRTGAGVAGGVTLGLTVAAVTRRIWRLS